MTNGSTLYVDGSPVLTTTITTQNQSNDALIGSGSTGGVEYFSGTIDDVTFYPTILTPARSLCSTGPRNQQVSCRARGQQRWQRVSALPAGRL